MLILKIILHYIQRVEREQLRNKKQWMTRIHLQGVRYCFLILYLFWKIVEETQMFKRLTRDTRDLNVNISLQSSCMKYYKAIPETLYDQNVKLAFNVLMSLKKWRKNIPFQFSLLSQNAVQWSSYHIKEKRIDLHSQLSTNSEIALQAKYM